MKRTSIAEDEPTPTPVPTSQERRAQELPSTRDEMSELIARFAHCQSIEELPPELRDNPFIQSIMRMTPEEEAREVVLVAAHSEAYALYDDDPARILAAIEAGTHPLQRSRAAHG